MPLQKLAVTKYLTKSFQFLGSFSLLTEAAVTNTFKRPFYFRLILEQIYYLGVQSLFLVFVTSLSTGCVMALQFGYGLTRFGGKLYVPKIVALTILRETGPVFTSLLVAGRIGSGITAEIGAMNVNQQIDAMRALGTSPIKRIVIPRLLASLIALPLLTVFSDFISLLGAMLMSFSELNIHPTYFWMKVIETIRLWDFISGLIKTVFFAFFISLLACWRGLTTHGGTQGVGSATTWVVVMSSTVIMLSDFILTKFFILWVFPKT